MNEVEACMHLMLTRHSNGKDGLNIEKQPSSYI